MLRLSGLKIQAAIKYQKIWRTNIFKQIKKKNKPNMMFVDKVISLYTLNLWLITLPDRKTH